MGRSADRCRLTQALVVSTRRAPVIPRTGWVACCRHAPDGAAHRAGQARRVRARGRRLQPRRRCMAPGASHATAGCARRAARAQEKEGQEMKLHSSPVPRGARVVAPPMPRSGLRPVRHRVSPRMGLARVLHSCEHLYTTPRCVAFIIGTGSDTQELGAAPRRDGAPLPAVKRMVLMVLLSVDCARRTSASRACAAAALTSAACWFLVGRC